MELILFYKFSFLVAFLSSGGLAIIGTHSFSRGTILEIFFLSQLSIFGNLVSKLCFETHFLDWKGILFSFLFYGIGKLLLHLLEERNKRNIDFSAYMIGGYLFLLSLQYLIIGIFPQLDAHMSVGLFGNMVTSSFWENLAIFGIFSLFFILYFKIRPIIEKNTLEKNILNIKNNSFYEGLFFATPLITSLYCLGFLYTMSFLLLPSLIIGSCFQREKYASIFIISVPISTSLVGLFLSIAFENISTTSMQITLLFLSLVTVRLIKSKSNY